MPDDNEVKEKIKDIYGDGKKIKHHTKVYITLLVIIVILAAIGYLFFSGQITEVASQLNLKIDDSDQAAQNTGDINDGLEDISNNLEGISGMI